MSRAQASLEFLTTYGWAFMVIIIMIGALSYYGITNPSIFVPKRCAFSPEISCEDFQLLYNGSDSIVRIAVRQSTGKTVFVSDIICTDTDKSVNSLENYLLDSSNGALLAENELSVLALTDDNRQWNPGVEKYLACKLSDDTFRNRIGDRSQVPVSIKIFKVDPGEVSDPFEHEVQGDIVGVVQEIS